MAKATLATATATTSGKPSKGSKAKAAGKAVAKAARKATTRRIATQHLPQPVQAGLTKLGLVPTFAAAPALLATGKLVQGATPKGTALLALAYLAKCKGPVNAATIAKAIGKAKGRRLPWQVALGWLTQTASGPTGAGRHFAITAAGRKALAAATGKA